MLAQVRAQSSRHHRKGKHLSSTRQVRQERTWFAFAAAAAGDGAHFPWERTLRGHKLVKRDKLKRERQRARSVVS